MTRRLRAGVHTTRESSASDYQLTSEKKYQRAPHMQVVKSEIEDRIGSLDEYGFDVEVCY